MPVYQPGHAHWPRLQLHVYRTHWVPASYTNFQRPSAPCHSMHIISISLITPALPFAIPGDSQFENADRPICGSPSFVATFGSHLTPWSQYSRMQKPAAGRVGWDATFLPTSSELSQQREHPLHPLHLRERRVAHSRVPFVRICPEKYPASAFAQAIS